MTERCFGTITELEGSFGKARIMPGRNLLVIWIAIISSVLCYVQVPHNQYFRVYQHAVNLIQTDYVDSVEDRTLFEHSMHGMMQSLDEFSVYLEPRTHQRLQEGLNQQFAGIGISMLPRAPESGFIVETPFLDGPAHTAGIQADDEIIEVNSVSTREKTMAELIDMIKGPVGDAVTITIRRPQTAESLKFEIVRAIVNVPNVEGDRRRQDGQWDFRLEHNPDIVYMRVKEFGSETAKEIASILRQEKKRGVYTGIVMDLRRNGGGFLDSAVDVCNLFIHDGTIVEVRGRNLAENSKPNSTIEKRLFDRYEADNTTTIDSSTPLAIVVNDESASASEIVAACLQDNNRATIVGERTFGKGSVQNIMSLGHEAEFGALKLTIAHFFRPSGKNIHKTEATSDDWGVHPNESYVIPMTDAQYQEYYNNRRERFIIRPQGYEMTQQQEQTDEATDDQLQRSIDFIRRERINSSGPNRV
ncbi:MAG: S41 family peptidase [Pirellulaceae bacterium]